MRLYGKLPNKKDLLQNKLKVRIAKTDPGPAFCHIYPSPPSPLPYPSLTLSNLSLIHPLPPQQERKYFDSGDYALSKAGKASDTGVTTIGTEHPQAENIPHLSASSPPNSATSTGSVGAGLPGSISLNHSHSQEGSSATAAATHFMPGSGGHRGSIQGMQGGVTSRSPVKESSYLARTASVDEVQDKGKNGDVEEEGKQKMTEEEMSISPPMMKEGLPIRR